VLVAGSAASLLDDGSRGEVGDGEFIVGDFLATTEVDAQCDKLAEVVVFMVGDFLATAVDSLRLTDPID